MEEFNVQAVALIKCFNESETSSRKIYELLEYVDTDGYNKRIRLKRILDKLINDLSKKRIDISNDSEASKCCLYTFQSLDENYQMALSYQILKSIYDIRDSESFKTGAMRIAQAYCNESHAQEGVLFVSTVEIQEAVGLIKQVFIIKCDFTEVDRVAGGNDLFERVDHAILGELKKGIVFPNFNGESLDESRVKLYQANSAKYFSMFLNLERPALRQEGYCQHIVEQLKDRYGENVAEEFELFALNKLVEKKKEVAEGRFTQELPREEVVEIIENVMLHDFNYSFKPSKLKFSLDSIDISCELSQYGKNVFLAQQGEDKFIIIKGNTLIDKGHINPVAMQKLDPLEEIIRLISQPDK